MAGRSSGPAHAQPGKRTLIERLGGASGPSAPPLRSAVQRRTAPDATAEGPRALPEPASPVQAAAERGIAGASHPLPYVEVMQPLFGGHDLGGIQAHTDGRAAAGARDMGAAAFAAGNHVAFAATPDVHTAAHEAAHVVQQRAGVQLQGGVGAAGDAHERNADAVADRVVQGRSAADLLPALDQAAATGVTERGVQRQDGDSEMSAAAVDAALAWARTSGLGVEAIMEVQRFCGMTGDQVDGVYNEQTARAVFAREPQIGLGQDGKADADFFFHAGLILTNEITAAVVSDEILAAVQQRFPRGITVAIYADYLDKSRNNLEFIGRAIDFAANEHAVGVSSGQLALDVPCPIHEVGDVIEVVQSIHRGLVQRWTDAQGGDAAGATAPDYTRVLNLALFSHGDPWGMALHEKEWISGGGLHNDEDPFNGYPSNIEAFVRGITGAVMPGVRVELFGCSAALGDDRDGNARSEFTEWGYDAPLAQGDVAGFGSFASLLSEALGDEATVLAHSTVGHTTENYAARVFGAEAGDAAGAGGLSYFDVMYPETYVQDQLAPFAALVPTLDLAALDATQRAALHDEVRREMWDHFRDSVVEEHRRITLGGTRRYAERTGIATFAMGQEMFLHPDHARELLHADWEEYWLPNHFREIQLP